MTKLINIRGTNGSGKSETVRWFLRDLQPGPSANVRRRTQGDIAQIDLCHYQKQGKNGPINKTAEGYAVPDHRVIVVGLYNTQAGGMDKLPSFEVARNAIRKAAEIADQQAFRAVLFEGVLCSTVFGSWADFCREMTDAGHEYWWTFLDVDAETALARIQARNGGKPIKTQQVIDKISAVGATERKAREAGFNVARLPTGPMVDGLSPAGRAVNEIIDGRADDYVI